MNKKRILLVLICFVLSFALIFSGCSGDNNNQNDTQNEEENNAENNEQDNSQNNEENTEKNENQNDTENTSNQNSENNNNKNNNDDEQNDVDEPEFVLPLSESKETLKITTFERPDAISPYEELPIWKEIEKRTNVAIEWETILDSEYSDTMRTRLASAMNLPDILCMMGEVTSYGQDGIILSLNDLIKTDAPNILNLFEKRPDVKRASSTVDGQIYQIGTFQEGKIRAMPFVLNIREDWLEKLELDVPETTDDLFNVLYAFRYDDPNGSGEEDVLAYWGNPVTELAEPFGLYLQYGGPFYADENGNVYYQYTHERMEKYLNWLHELHSNQLLALNYDVPDPNVFQKLLSNQIGSAKIFSDTAFNINTMMHDSGFADAKYQPIPAVEGPDGFRGYELEPMINMGYWGNGAITNSCENPNLAMRWLDYVYASDEATLLFNWGIEGETFTVDEDGEKHFTEKVTGVVDLMNKYGGWPFVPWTTDEEACQELANSVEGYENISERYSEYYVKPFPNIFADNDRQERLETLMRDINTYTSEQVNNFVKGERSLSEFEDYVNELKEMGIDEAVEIQQSLYDDYMSN